MNKDFRTIKRKKLPTAFFKPGVFTLVALDDGYLEEYYGKRDCRIGYKVFRHEYKPIDEFLWGKRRNLLECTKVQNVLWSRGYAPRILDLVIIDTPEGKHWCQITEIINMTDNHKMDSEKMQDILHEVGGIGIAWDTFDPNPRHQHQKYLIDFQHFYFLDNKYHNFVIKKYLDQANWGSNPKPYQSVPELGIEGQRTQKDREGRLHLDQIDFKDKTVIDFGCSGGAMCRYALSRGAKRVVGIDLPHVVDAAREVSNYLGYFNIDYFGGNFSHKHRKDIYDEIKKKTGLDKFDIVLYLSVQQLGMPDYLEDITGEYLFLEGHTGDHEETFKKDLEKIFNTVDYLGVSTDHSIRPLFRCQNV